jgi:hypothetical protein
MNIRRIRFLWPASAVLVVLGATGAWTIHARASSQAGAGTAAKPQDKCAERTAGLGYRDTPVIPEQKWKVHDLDRPHPPVVTPGAQSLPVKPPSDAIVLFDGKDLSQWVQRGRREDRGKMLPPKWVVRDGYFESVGGTGDLVSKEKFGDAQYHIEWASPSEICGTSQWRGNSGVLIMGRYEIQVLDSYNSPTYADGQAASIYGQWPPMVNASLPPGQWQSYDIIFEAPKFENGKLVKNPYVTILHNGVVVHHRQKIIGPMAHRVVRAFEPHGDEEPLAFQDHDVPVRYRNIWVRRIKGYDQQ